MCGQHNVRASAEDSTGQNTDKEYTLNSRIEIKIQTTTPRRRIIVELLKDNFTIRYQQFEAAYMFKYMGIRKSY